jgi:hypothetical protein
MISRQTRIQQLIDEIGRPLLRQAYAALKAEADAATYLLDDKSYAILEQLDETLDPMVLLPLLNVPKKVRRHFEDAFKRLKLSRRRQGRPPVPSYKPVGDEAIPRLAARFVRYLTTHGAPEDKAIELATLIYDEVPPSKLRAVLAGKASAVRNLRARRSAR